MSYKRGPKLIVRQGSRDQIMFDSGQKRIWKTEEKAKVQDCMYFFVNKLGTTHPINFTIGNFFAIIITQ